MGAVAIPNITVGIVAAGATVTVLCGVWSTYSWTRHFILATVLQVTASAAPGVEVGC